MLTSANGIIVKPGMMLATLDFNTFYMIEDINSVRRLVTVQPMVWVPDTPEGEFDFAPEGYTEMKSYSEINECICIYLGRSCYDQD